MTAAFESHTRRGREPTENNSLVGSTTGQRTTRTTCSNWCVNQSPHNQQQTECPSSRCPVLIISSFFFTSSFLPSPSDAPYLNARALKECSAGEPAALPNGKLSTGGRTINPSGSGSASAKTCWDSETSSQTPPTQRYAMSGLLKDSPAHFSERSNSYVGVATAEYGRQRHGADGHLRINQAATRYATTWLSISHQPTPSPKPTRSQILRAALLQHPLPRSTSTRLWINNLVNSNRFWLRCFQCCTYQINF